MVSFDKGEAESVEPKSKSDKSPDVQIPVPTVCQRQKRNPESRVQPPIPAPRKSKRANAGAHPNPHHEPRSVLESMSLSPAMVSHILASQALNEVKHSYSVIEDVDS